MPSAVHSEVAGVDNSFNQSSLCEHSWGGSFPTRASIPLTDEAVKHLKLMIKPDYGKVTP